MCKNKCPEIPGQFCEIQNFFPLYVGSYFRFIVCNRWPNSCRLISPVLCSSTINVTPAYCIYKQCQPPYLALGKGQVYSNLYLPYFLGLCINTGNYCSVKTRIMVYFTQCRFSQWHQNILFWQNFFFLSK